MTQLVSFPIVSSQIRACQIEGQCWFVAKDVFDALQITWHGQKSLTKIKAEWKGVTNLVTPSESQTGRGGGEQELLIIAEPAVYKIAFRSDKPEAERFTDRVAEIVTTIRKTGQYIAPQATPQYEQISNNDQRNLQRVVWMICDRFHRKSLWAFAVWQALRQVTGCAVPNRFEVRHLPLIAVELKRIMEISVAVREHCTALEKEAVRRIIKNREAAAPFVEQMQAHEAEWLNQLKPWLAQLHSSHHEDLDALAQRSPAACCDHSDYAELITS